MPRPASSHAAAARSSRPNSSQRNTGRHDRRTIVTKLGSVTIAVLAWCWPPSVPSSMEGDYGQSGRIASGGMTTLFTRIIAGEIPGRFVWRDDRAVGFLTIAPITPGHVLVVPVAEVDHWVDLEPDLAAHLVQVSQKIAAAQMAVFKPVRIGMIIAGLEVPH